MRFAVEDTAYLYLRTYHDSYKLLPDDMLFDLDTDPHQQNNLAEEPPVPLAQAKALLYDWLTDNLMCAGRDVDPLLTVVKSGGGFHTCGNLPVYLERLRETDRAHLADELAKKFAHELSARRD